MCDCVADVRERARRWHHCQLGAGVDVGGATTSRAPVATTILHTRVANTSACISVCISACTSVHTSASTSVCLSVGISVCCTHSMQWQLRAAGRAVCLLSVVPRGRDRGIDEALRVPAVHDDLALAPGWHRHVLAGEGSGHGVLSIGSVREERFAVELSGSRPQRLSGSRVIEWWLG